MSKRFHSLYGSKQWRDLRPLVYQRDRGVCQICGKPVPPAGYHVDHIRTLADGGSPLDIRNLRLTHGECNLKRRRPVKSVKPSRVW